MSIAHSDALVGLTSVKGFCMFNYMYKGFTFSVLTVKVGRPGAQNCTGWPGKIHIAWWPGIIFHSPEFLKIIQISFILWAFLRISPNIYVKSADYVQNWRFYDVRFQNLTPMFTVTRKNIFWKKWSRCGKYMLPHDKTNKMACAPSEDWNQPGHPPSLIRVFTVSMKKAWVLSYPLSAQLRLWSDWVDAQADLR